MNVLDSTKYRRFARLSFTQASRAWAGHGLPKAPFQISVIGDFPRQRAHVDRTSVHMSKAYFGNSTKVR